MMAHEAEYPYIFRSNMKIYLEALSIRMGVYRYSGEVLVAGGSSLILGHTFRSCTEDIDAYINGRGIRKCIDEVRGLYGLTGDWMNSDVVKSASWSVRVMDNAELVVGYANLNVYRVCDLDLVCMKLVSFRDKDIDDLEGLLNDCPYITQDMITQRIHYLYGEYPYDKLKKEAILYVRQNVKHG